MKSYIFMSFLIVAAGAARAQTTTAAPAPAAKPTQVDTFDGINLQKRERICESMMRRSQSNLLQKTDAEDINSTDVESVRRDYSRFVGRAILFNFEAASDETGANAEADRKVARDLMRWYANPPKKNATEQEKQQRLEQLKMIAHGFNGFNYVHPEANGLLAKNILARLHVDSSKLTQPTDQDLAKAKDNFEALHKENPTNLCGDNFPGVIAFLNASKKPAAPTAQTPAPAPISGAPEAGGVN